MPSFAAPSVQTVLDQIQQQFPDTPFIALGQTVFWDEPVKAIWRHLLDHLRSEAQLIAGVHDTDYFAKTTAHIGSERNYVALPHDDGQTRDLWSAAGEMSAFFGSESVPTRAFYEKQGVPFDQLAGTQAEGKNAFYRDQTTAWGWRGIVSTGSHDVIAHDVPVLEIKDALLEQMDWAFAESLACLETPEVREAAMQTAASIRCWLTEFLADCQIHCRLSDLYQTLLPRFYHLLLGSAPANFATTTSTELFCFHTGTYQRPRFALLSHFLNPTTQAVACDAYNRAVAGSGIYTLDHFGDGALPFDVVVPGRGRGTLRLISGGVVIETHPSPTQLSGEVDHPEALARLLEEAFGQNVVLVGKAVTLVDMIAAEHLIVFHETASGYTGRTQTMNKTLHNAGMAFTLHPIVRLAYPTWDALSALPASTLFRLPEHLAAAFGTEVLSAPEFAHRWRAVVDQQRHLLQTVRDLHKTRDLMQFLENNDQEYWHACRTEYEAALRTLKEIAGKSNTLASRMEDHEQQWQMWKHERQGLERRKGNDWRENIQPLRTKSEEGEQHGEDMHALQKNLNQQLAIRATAFDEPLMLCRERIDATKALLAEFRRQRRLLERSPAAQQARDTVTRLTRKTQMARLVLVRNAFLTIEGLEHTHLRPTAWWLPLVDPSGQWLTAMAQGTQARLEDLD